MNAPAPAQTGRGLADWIGVDMTDRICTVPGCGNKHRAHGYCHTHYLRVAQYGTTELQQRYTICTVDGCDTTVRSSGSPYCEMHYGRIRRNGTLEPVGQVPRKTGRGICTVDGCDENDAGLHGLCAKHYARQRRHGDPLVVHPTGPAPGPTHPSWVGDDITYSGIHERVRAHRGSAVNHDCVDCGGQAAQWSYDHSDPDEKNENGLPYSADMDHYEPRCVSCHKRFDLDLIGAR